jgi:hypothetical protein
MSNDRVCPTFRKVFVASVFGVCLFLIPNGVHSATSNSATLKWDANQESDLAGYHAYHGTTSGNYGSPQNAGTTPTYQYDNLESNKTHYFSVTAYDTSGNESFPSLEESKAIPGPGGTVTSSPASSTVKKLAKAEKKKQKKLAKIQKKLAKIEQKLVTHADNPKKVSRLNRKKVKLLAKRDQIQEKYSIN